MPTPPLRVPLILASLVVLVACCAGSALAAPARTSAAPIRGTALVASLFAGIPQHGNTLGNPKAKVTLYEFGDLRCPVCRAYETGYLPAFVHTWVRTGKVKLSFQLWPILGPDSVVAARAGLAAQKQNRFWQFAELFYLNQRSESVHYVDAIYLDRLASAAKLNVTQFERARLARYTQPLAEIANVATSSLFQGTPSFGVSGPKGGFAIGGAMATATQFGSVYRRALGT